MSGSDVHNGEGSKGKSKAKDPVGFIATNPYTIFSFPISLKVVNVIMIMNLKNRILRKILRTIGSPVDAKHLEYSILFSGHDDLARPSEYLLDLSIQVIHIARKINLGEIVTRSKRAPVDFHIDIYPTTHYKLLASLMFVLEPEQVIEIGTGTGLSCLSMKQFLPKGSNITTFDIVGWKDYKDTHLEKEDFDNSLVQYTDDLQDYSMIEKHRGILEKANLIFIDAFKDGVMEKILIDNLSHVDFKRKVLFVFDDIRLWNMLKIWRDINRPKLDLTSFGSWTGTGLVEWN